MTRKILHEKVANKTNWWNDDNNNEKKATATTPWSGILSTRGKKWTSLIFLFLLGLDNSAVVKVNVIGCVDTAGFQNIIFRNSSIVEECGLVCVCLYISVDLFVCWLALVCVISTACFDRVGFVWWVHHHATRTIRNVMTLLRVLEHKVAPAILCTKVTL